MIYRTVCAVYTLNRDQTGSIKAEAIAVAQVDAALKFVLRDRTWTPRDGRDSRQRETHPRQAVVILAVVFQAQLRFQFAGTGRYFHGHNVLGTAVSVYGKMGLRGTRYGGLLIGSQNRARAA